ncbi:PDZ domain-containing protein [bacterium]|nr:PDZ domain-containing protein [bacterium]
MRKVFFLLALFFLFGCASEQEAVNYNTVYMDRCLSTGMMAVGLDDDIRADTGLPALDGMYIANVEPRSAAASAHLKTGDVLLQVGEMEVYDKESFAKAFLELEGKKRATVKVWRKGALFNFELPLTF